MKKTVRAMPIIADQNMINAAYTLIETMPKGTEERHKRIVAAVWAAMAEFAPGTRPHGLTNRMRQALEVIGEYIDENGRSPSYEDIAQLTGREYKSDVFHIVQALKRRGFIDFTKGTARSIRIIKREGEQ